MTNSVRKRSFAVRFLYAIASHFQAGCWMQQLRANAKPFNPIDASPLVVIAPHQDDETLGCGGLIALKRELGAAVTIVFMTNGAASPTRGHTSPEACVALRRQEALAALSILGVANNSVFFLNGPDGSLDSLSPNDFLKIQQELLVIIEAAKPAQVATTFRHDVHPDHEASFRLCKGALGQFGQDVEILEYPIWSLWHMRDENAALARASNIRILDIRAVRPLKQKALICFSSQISASILPHRGHVPKRLVRRLTGDSELFFVSETKKRTT